MPYRQPWEIGREHVADLRRQALVERARSATSRRPTRFQIAVAGSARAVARHLSGLADRLDARPVRPAAHPTTRRAAQRPH